MSELLLTVRDLTIEFPGRPAPVRAVDRLSFDLAAGETLAVVGESGCGKTVTALSVMGLLSSARLSGSVRVGGQEVLGLTPRARRRLHCPRLGMVFQSPMAALNPVQTIGAQLVEAVTAAGVERGAAARARALELLRLVRMPDPAARLGDYPHRLSGGMRQRVVIAMALAASPALLIADEPTTALDVTIQAQILQLLTRLKGELGMALLLVTHDLGVVAETADRVLVMQGGRAVEEQPVIGLFERPRHPYTAALIAARPKPRARLAPRPRLREVGGAALREVHAPC